MFVALYFGNICKIMIRSWISVNLIPSWQYKQGNYGPPYDTSALQRTNCDPWAMNKKFRIHMLLVTHTRFSSPVITVAQRKFSNMGNFLKSWFSFLSVAEMEVTRDDTSQSLSMALKQKDSKIGLLTQNLQQQEGENMAMEAKLVFRSMKREKEKKNWSEVPERIDPVPLRAPIRRSLSHDSGIMSISSFFISSQNASFTIFLHSLWRNYNFLLIPSTNNTPSALNTQDVF